MKAGTDYPLERRRFAVLGILWLSNAVFWASWFAQAPLLKSYWGAVNHVSFSNAQYLLGAVNIVAMCTVFASGYFYDRVGPRLGTATMLVMIVVGFGLRPLTVHSFPLTLLLTIVAGCGQPLNSAPAPVVSRWFGHHRMAFPLAMAMTSVSVGQATGQLTGAMMAADFGVAGAFSIYSVALVACLVLWFAFVPHGPKRPAGPPGPALPPLRHAFSAMMKTRGSWTFAMLGALYTGILTSSQSLLPGVLQHSFRLSPPQAGRDTAVFGAAEIIGMLVIGYRLGRSPRLARHGLWISVGEFVGQAALGVMFWAAIRGLGAVLFCWAVCGFFFLTNFVFALASMERLKMAGSQTAGIAAGFYFTFANAGGLVFPAILARIEDAVGSPNVGFVGITIMAACAIVLWASAVARRGLFALMPSPVPATPGDGEAVPA